VTRLEMIHRFYIKTKYRRTFPAVRPSIGWLVTTLCVLLTVSRWQKNAYQIL